MRTTDLVQSCSLTYYFEGGKNKERRRRGREGGRKQMNKYVKGGIETHPTIWLFIKKAPNHTQLRLCWSVSPTLNYVY